MIPCPNHPDQIMEAQEIRCGPGVRTHFACEKCEEERAARIKGMFPARGEFGAPAAFQGPSGANDTPSLQETIGVKMCNPVAELTEWRARAEVAERPVMAAAEIACRRELFKHVDAYAEAIDRLEKIAAILGESNRRSRPAQADGWVMQAAQHCEQAAERENAYALDCRKRNAPFDVSYVMGRQEMAKGLAAHFRALTPPAPGKVEKLTNEKAVLPEGFSAPMQGWASWTTASCACGCGQKVAGVGQFMILGDKMYVYGHHPHVAPPAEKPEPLTEEERKDVEQIRANHTMRGGIGPIRTHKNWEALTLLAIIDRRMGGKKGE